MILQTTMIGREKGSGKQKQMATQFFKDTKWFEIGWGFYIPFFPKNIL